MTRHLFATILVTMCSVTILAVFPEHVWADEAIQIFHPSHEGMQRLSSIQKRVRTIGTDILDFWMKQGPDDDHGGFYGILDANGDPVAGADKGLTQQTRHLWSLSVWYRHYGQPSALKGLCDNLYSYILTHYYDPSDNQFHFTVNYNGDVTDRTRDLYGQSFAILSLAEYARTFNNTDAAAYALKCFRSVDAKYQDDIYFGYDETMVAGPERSKNTGNIMHLIEAYTVLYKATGDSLVKERLNQFIDVVIQHIVQPEGYCRMFFSRDWTPTGDAQILYGHDLQLAWLLLEAASAIDRDDLTLIAESTIAMGSTSEAMAFDTERGGYFHDGDPDGTVTRRTKIWWVQCESLSCLYWLYRLTGENRYLDHIDKTLDFIENFQQDTFSGEWWAGIEDGKVTDWLFGFDKGNLRKASYHNIRAMVYMDKWITAHNEG